MSYIINQVVDEGGHGQHDIVYLERLVNEAHYDDEVKRQAVADFDLWRGRRVMAVLKTKYPRHLWCVEHDLAQGICKISLPILMGITNWFILNLGTHGDLTPGMVISAGGELLERYKLPRGRFEIGSFLEARAKHSALVDRRRPVPV